MMGGESKWSGFNLAIRNTILKISTYAQIRIIKCFLKNFPSKLQ